MSARVGHLPVRFSLKQAAKACEAGELKELWMPYRALETDRGLVGVNEVFSRFLVDPIDAVLLLRRVVGWAPGAPAGACMGCTPEESRSFLELLLKAASEAESRMRELSEYRFEYAVELARADFARAAFMPKPRVRAADELRDVVDLVVARGIIRELGEVREPERELVVYVPFAVCLESHVFFDLNSGEEDRRLRVLAKKNDKVMGEVARALGVEVAGY